MERGAEFSNHDLKTFLEMYNNRKNYAENLSVFKVFKDIDSHRKNVKHDVFGKFAQENLTEGDYEIINIDVERLKDFRSAFLYVKMLDCYNWGQHMTHVCSCLNYSQKGKVYYSHQDRSSPINQFLTCGICSAEWMKLSNEGKCPISRKLLLVDKLFYNHQSLFTDQRENYKKSWFLHIIITREEAEKINKETLDFFQNSLKFTVWSENPYLTFIVIIIIIIYISSCCKREVKCPAIIFFPHFFLF